MFATHPLLGPLDLRRDGIVSIQRSDARNPSPRPNHESGFPDPFSPVLRASASRSAAAAESAVRFSNKTMLDRNIRNPSRRIPGLEIPVTRKTGSVLSQECRRPHAPGTTPETTADHEASLTLTNGDVVRGQLTSVSMTSSPSTPGCRAFEFLPPDGLQRENRGHVPVPLPRTTRTRRMDTIGRSTRVDLCELRVCFE